MKNNGSRLPLNTFGIPFALCGLASVWSEASSVLGLSPYLPLVFWLIAAGGLVCLIAVHLWFGYRSDISLVQQIRHPTQAPMAALVPLILLLVGDGIEKYSTGLGIYLIFVALALGSSFGVVLASTWLKGHLILSNVHGGHLLPISGFSSVAAVVSARHHWVDLGVAFLSVGLSTWFIFAALLIFRASRHGALPASLSPTRSILAAPPPLAAIAYFEMRGGVIDFWLCALLLLTAVTIIFQVTLMPSLFRLPHSTGNWAFTFPSAAVAVLTMTLASNLQVPGWQLIVIVFAALVTLLVVTNAARSVMKG